MTVGAPERPAPLREPEIEAVAPPLNRMAIAVLALAGMFVAGYLLLHKLGVIGTLACGVGDCGTVQASPWSVIAGIPVPLLGLGGYLALLGVALAGLQPRFADSRGLGMLLFALGAIAFGFSVWFTYLEAFVIHAWCMWCVGSAIIATLIFACCLPELAARRRA